MPRKDEVYHLKHTEYLKTHAVNEQMRMLVIGALRKGTKGILDKHVLGSKRVVEVGCGTGFFARHLAPGWLNKGLISFDIARFSVEEFKRQKPDAQVLQASIYELPFNPSSVDTLIGLSSFDSFSFLDKAIAESHRVLREGGKIVLFQYLGIGLGSPLTTSWEEVDNNRNEAERYHRRLVSVVQNQGFNILEGTKDYLEYTDVEQLKRIKGRVKLPEIQARLKPAPSRNIILAAHNMGALFAAQALPGQEREVLTYAEGILQMPNVLTRVNFKPDRDMIEVVKMRYLIAEK